MTQPSVSSQASSGTLTAPATSVAGAATPSTASAPTTQVTQPTPSLNWSNSSASTPGFGDTLHVMGGLVIVLALIFGLGLLVKRLSSGSKGRGAQRILKTIDTQAVGSKERIAVVEVSDTWLVVGISPQGITALHSMPRPDDLSQDDVGEDAPRTGMPFSQALREAARQTFGRKQHRDLPSTDRDSHNDRNDHV